jgi:hypothetical protein
MSLFRASDPAGRRPTGPCRARAAPYPVNPSYPDPDAPTQRLYRPMDEPEPHDRTGRSGPYEPLPPAHSVAPHRGVLVALAIAVLALLASGVPATSPGAPGPR